MQKLWRLKSTSTANDFEAMFPDISRAILSNRNIDSQAEVETILTPSYERDLHDPFLLLDMDKAVERILRAIKDNEKILVFGDYDADGVPATTLLVSFFKKISFKNLDTYIPDRHNEQYGLSIATIEKFSEDKVDLIVTVDCGVSNVEEIKRANELGIDVVVTDHHTVPEVIPEALAVINPKRPGSLYPYKYLSGTGVAFKLVQALIKKGNFDDIPLGWEKWLLDLVAIATVSDMVPITEKIKL
jgi:single-stranded-DNA-specific exonuclease